MSRVWSTLSVLAVFAGVAAWSMGFRLVVIGGGSMEPSIEYGSIALLRPVAPGKIEVGDVVAFRHRQGLVTHRVVGVDVANSQLATRGDANPRPDADPVPFDRVRGKVAIHIPKAGLFAQFIRSANAWPGLVLVGLGLLLLPGPPSGRAHSIGPPAARG